MSGVAFSAHPLRRKTGVNAQADRWIASECVVTRSESDLCSFSWSGLPAFPRWRTGRGVMGYKLVGHAEQVPQHIGIDARQANQYGGMADIVIRHVVNIGGRSEQLGAVIEIHANDKRGGFGRAISGDTCQEFSMYLECRLTVRGALLNARQRQSDIPHGVEVDCASGHWSARFPRTHCTSLARSSGPKFRHPVSALYSL
jgi:hypothetical protein